jgi:hypothetical protein
MIKSKLSLSALLLVLMSSVMLTACGTDDGPGGGPDPTPTLFEETEIKDDDGNVIETIVTITDQGEGTGSTTFSKDKTWVLNGLVFVNDGQTLNIEPGTVIKGKSGQGENASALVVAQGALIMAEGTAIRYDTSLSDMVEQTLELVTKSTALH